MRYIFLIVTIIWYSFSFSINGQISRANEIVIDSTLALRNGIYYSCEEFLNNSPSVQSSFKVLNDNPDYFFHKNEKNNYYLDYYAVNGIRRVVPLEEVWGYTDGTGVFINYEGKPFQLLYFGAISILRYEKTYHKDGTAQALTYIATGNTVTDIIETINAFYTIEDNVIFPYEEKHLKSIISKFPSLYSKYMKEPKKRRWNNRLGYISEYNKKHPIEVTETSIILK